MLCYPEFTHQTITQHWTTAKLQRPHKWSNYRDKVPHKTQQLMHLWWRLTVILTGKRLMIIVTLLVGIWISVSTYTQNVNLNHYFNIWPTLYFYSIILSYSIFSNLTYFNLKARHVRLLITILLKHDSLLMKFVDTKKSKPYSLRAERRAEIPGSLGWLIRRGEGGYKSNY